MLDTNIQAAQTRLKKASKCDEQQHGLVAKFKKNNTLNTAIIKEISGRKCNHLRVFGGQNKLSFQCYLGRKTMT